MGIPRKLKRAFGSKKIRKLASGKCIICNEPEYTLLDVHRIKPGSEGGKYSYENTAVLCCRCHRLEQDGKIIVKGWVNSTAGRLLHIIDENGEEQFLQG